MKLALVLLAMGSSLQATVKNDIAAENVALAVHGGYVLEDRSNDPASAYRMALPRYCAGVFDALEAGYRKIKSGKPGLDGVEAAVRTLEDNPYFNAGKGAVMTHRKTFELDASIMEGKALQAGAVAGVMKVSNPISFARRVMEKTPHVMLIGAEADRFAESLAKEKLPADEQWRHFHIVPQKYFWTPWREQQLITKLKQDEAARKLKRGASLSPAPEVEMGTVGAVVVDAAGDLAAATSTGGTNDKQRGRVGDSPIIGAGTYADDRGAAVSCTGHGEYFIRHHVASRISQFAEMQPNRALSDIVRQVITQELNEKAGEGGAIALNRKGQLSLVSNTDGMIRGYVTRAGERHAFVDDTECPPGP